MPAPTPLLPETLSDGSAFRPSSVKVNSQTQTKLTKSVSGKVLTSKRGGQHYTMTLAYPPMREEHFREVQAFLEDQQGRHGIFYVKLSQPDPAAGQAVGNFCTFDNSEKLFRIKQVVPSLATFPEAPAGYLTVETTDIYIRCSLAKDSFSTTTDKAGLVQITLDLVERT